MASTGAVDKLANGMRGTRLRSAEDAPPRPPQKSSDRALQLERRRDGQLWAIRSDLSEAVRVRRCFPWSEPGHFISLRNNEDEEFALVVDPRELDPDSLDALELGMAEAGFVIEITAIRRLDEEVEIYDWEVETLQGPRRFQTKRDDWPRSMPGGGLLIRDVAGDLFYVADPQALDPRSAGLIWIFAD